MLKNAIECNETGQWQTTGSFSYSGALIFGSSDCPTCPKGQKFDIYRNNKSMFYYSDKIVSNANPEIASARAQGGGGGFNTDMVDKIAGANGVNMDVKEGLIEFAKKSGVIGKSGEKYLSFTKAAGKMMGVTGAVTSWMDYNKNPSTGALVKAFANTGLVFLRVNPFVGVGLGILDLTGGSDWFYNQVGNGIDNMGGPRR